jgi:hypothetical protein
MNLSEILRYAFLGTVIYGSYKLGEKNGESKAQSEKEFRPSPIESRKFSEIEFIIGEIEKLRKKPNKNRKDRDNIELLEIRLKQLYNY